MANQLAGRGVIFGFPGGPTYTLAGFGDITQLQSAGFEANAETAEIKNLTGATSAVVFYDAHQSQTWDFYISQVSTTGNITVTAVPTAGMTLAATNTNFTPATGTYLVMPPVKVDFGNTEFAKCSMTLKRWLENTVP